MKSRRTFFECWFFALLGCLNTGSGIDAQRADLARVGGIAVQHQFRPKPAGPNYSTFGPGIGEATPQTAEGPIVYSVSFNDPGGTYSSYYAAITSCVQAAGADWARYLIGSGNLEVEVMIAANASGGGNSATSGFVRNDGARDIFEQGAAYEVRTGIDPNGATPDIYISLPTNFLTNVLWFDPQPAQRSASVPADRVDAISVFSRWLGRAFAFNGWMNPTTGELPATYMSTFDENIHFDGSNFFFVGPTAKMRYGGPVPLTYGNIYRVGNNPPRPGSDLLADLMNANGFEYGRRYYISQLDVDIVKDCEVAVAPYLEILSIARSGSGADFSGRGVPTAVHKIQATNDLSQAFDPNPIATPAGDSNGNFQFTDVAPPNPLKRFYRVVFP